MLFHDKRTSAVPCWLSTKQRQYCASSISTWAWGRGPYTASYYIITPPGIWFMAHQVIYTSVWTRTGEEELCVKKIRGLANLFCNVAFTFSKVNIFIIYCELKIWCKNMNLSWFILAMWRGKCPAQGHRQSVKWRLQRRSHELVEAVEESTLH